MYLILGITPLAQGSQSTTINVLDLNTGVWSVLQPALNTVPPPAINYAGTQLGNLVILDGGVSSGNQLVTGTWAYDLTRNLFFPVGAGDVGSATPVQQSAHTAASYNGLVRVFLSSRCSTEFAGILELRQR